jgi:hypothetical protein
LLALVVATGASFTRAAVAAHLGLTARHSRRVLAEIASTYPDISVLSDGTKMSQEDKDVPPAWDKNVRSPYKERARAPAVSHHQKENEKRVENFNSKVKSLVSDDEKSPEAEFLQRVRSRHPEIDAENLLRKLRKPMGAFTLTEFLAYDKTRTMSPQKITNPAGYYISLAKDINQNARADFLKRHPHARAVGERPRCALCVGGMVGMDYCTCQLGCDLKRVQRRKQAKTEAA